MFDAATETADERAFAERSEDDRHHFRFIVSPEDGAELGDLKTFTRELMLDVEKDLGTKLDWLAVDHWNTDNQTSCPLFVPPCPRLRRSQSASSIEFPHIAS